jgi:hypothetical protein
MHSQNANSPAQSPLPVEENQSMHLSTTPLIETRKSLNEINTPDNEKNEPCSNDDEDNFVTLRRNSIVKVKIS